ncbi:hypothetical protein HaLaN_27192, partial [Haematococcus lacustris]
GSDETLSAVQPNAKYTSTSRRKATQKPVGPDQKRQAFSKRKRGIVLKAYQLYKLTDAKVFMFVVNDKGASWSYASPGFHSTQLPEHLMYLREKAGLPHLHPSSTECERPCCPCTPAQAPTPAASAHWAARQGHIWGSVKVVATAVVAGQAADPTGVL